jgi:hypothetical protein
MAKWLISFMGGSAAGTVYDLLPEVVQQSLWSGLVSWLQSFFGFIAQQGASVLTAFFGRVLPTFAPTVDWAPWLTYLQWANYFVPLNEGIVFGSMLFFTWLGVFVYRLVKSYVPTVSS